VALHQCLKWMEGRQLVSVRRVLKDHVAAVSCGIFQGTPVTDLDYAEDSNADTDANFVITGNGGLVEIQGTAEGAPFSEAEFMALLELAKNATRDLVEKQREAISA
jgi:ribonuclease PH